MHLNGKRKTLDKSWLSYEEICQVAKVPLGTTVTFRRAGGFRREGELQAGQTIMVLEATEINTEGEHG